MLHVVGAAILLGLRAPQNPALLHHNVFLTEQHYEAAFDQVTRALSLAEPPQFYLCAPGRIDPTFAPPNGDSLMVLVPVGHVDDRQTQDWVELTARARSAVLARLADAGLPDLATQIIYEGTYGPREYRQELHLAKGAAFGLGHNLLQMGYMRPHNRHPRYGNLYFVGASIHPGTGVPLVLLSAQLVTERVAAEHPIDRRSGFPGDAPAA